MCQPEAQRPPNGVLYCWPCKRYLHPACAQCHLLDFHSGSGTRYTIGKRAVAFTQMAQPAEDDVRRDVIAVGNQIADAEETLLQY